MHRRRWLVMSVAVCALGALQAASAYALPIGPDKQSPPQAALPTGSSPGGVRLAGVDTLSPANAWAVGIAGHYLVYRTVAYHWSGRAWNRTVTPNPGGSNASDALLAVAYAGPGDVWAVGANEGQGAGRGPIAEHWDGATWTNVPISSERGFGSLSSVTAVSSTDVWAVGDYSVGVHGAHPLFEHWDGHAWTASSLVGSESGDDLSAVSAASSKDIWAVGGTSHGSKQIPVTLHWDGTGWTRVPCPHPPGGPSDASLQSVDVILANDVWAVGFAYAPHANGPFAVHWDGSTWSVVPMALDGVEFGILNAVDGDSSNDVWAVGQTSDRHQSIVEHWDGAGWSLVDHPDGPHPPQVLNGVSALTASDAWTVGDTRPDAKSQPVWEHWDGTNWNGP